MSLKQMERIYKMKKVVLLCAGGASTGMLVKKLESVAEKLDKKYSFSAYGIAEATTVASDADIVLLGPQVSYQLEDIKKQLSGVKVAAVDMIDYGTMNAEKILKQISSMIGE